MIQVNGIKKKYGDKYVLNGVDFTVKKGQCAVIVGQNGCGKSTLLSILAGVMKPDEGTVCYNGKDALKNSDIFATVCGYLPQKNPLLEQLSVKDNLWLWNVSGKCSLERARKAYELDEVWKMPVHKLSGGMKRRVALALTLQNQPSILLLDEPTTALDLYYKELMHRQLDEFIKCGGTILLVSHDEMEITNCDKCLFMENGLITEIAQGKDVLQELRLKLRAAKG